MNGLNTALVVDDDFLMRGMVIECLEQNDIIVMQVGSLDEANRALASASFDLVFTDPSIVGSLTMLEHHGAPPVVIVMPSFSSVEKAVDQIKTEGGFDYLIKPFSCEQVGIVLSRVRELSELKTELKKMREEPVDPSVAPLAPPVGSRPSEEMYNLEELEKRTIFRVMQETGGSRNIMADKLGISIRTLRNKLNKYQAEETLQTY